MSYKKPSLYHLVNGHEQETWAGFSWPAFFFGIIWLAVKEMWVHFIVSLVILIITSGFGAIFIWIFYGCMGNSFHRNMLLKKGYLADPPQEKPTIEVHRNISIADEIAKLSALRDSGVLSESDFTLLKSKLLNA